MSEPVFQIENVTLKYPTRFEKGESAVALFLVDVEKAQALISESGFEVAKVLPGKALMTLVAVNYIDTQCGKYQEIALAFAVKPVGKGRHIPFVSPWLQLLRGTLPTFTWCLPVTTTLSEQCGIQMWGFPKTVERIDHSHYEGVARFAWYRDDKPVMTISIPSEGHREQSPISPPVYSLMDSRPMVSYLTQWYRQVGFHRNRFEIALGDLPLCDTLRELGLPKTPLMATWNGDFTFEMSSPQRL